MITLGRRTKSPEPGRKSANWVSSSAGIVVFYCMKSMKILNGLLRSCKSKDRQHNGQIKKAKRPNNDLQNTEN